MSSMFQQSFLQTSSTASAARRRSTFLAVSLQVSLVAAGVILPRLYIEALPLTPPTPVVPLSMGRPAPENPRPTRPSTVIDRSTAPVYQVVNNNRPVITAQPASDAVETGNPQGPAVDFTSQGCVKDCVIAALPPVDPPHPVVNPSPTPRTRPLSILHPGSLISSVQPVYPKIALQIGQQGIVNLHAVIAPDGRISELRVVDGPPLLQSSALDAVSQWRYQPYILNGQAIPVETQIQVKFTLQR